MKFIIETEPEEDGRWIAEALELPGALAYGQTAEEARARVQALALRVVAERLEHGEIALELVSVSSQQNESMASDKSQAGSRCHPSDWLGYQASIRITSNIVSTWLG